MWQVPNAIGEQPSGEIGFGGIGYVKGQARILTTLCLVAYMDKHDMNIFEAQSCAKVSILLTTAVD